MVAPRCRGPLPTAGKDAAGMHECWGYATLTLLQHSCYRVFWIRERHKPRCPLPRGSQRAGKAHEHPRDSNCVHA